MKNFALIVAAATLAMAGSSAQASRPTGEQTLARLLAGRVAGKPVRCVPAFNGRDLRVIDRVGVVYDAGRTIYVARARDPDSLRDEDVLITHRFGSDYCRDDQMHTVERYSGALRSVVFLDDFVPYTRAG